MQAVPPIFHGSISSADRAFSLMEMLISVGIIALLASLLVPTVKGLVKGGNTVKDAANLKAIANANILYAVDNDGRCVVAQTSAPRSKVWYGELRPYLGLEPGSETNLTGHLPILVSPSDPNKGGLRGPSAIDPDNYRRRSYGVNYYTREFISGSTSEYRGRKMIVLPSATMIFVGDFPSIEFGTHGINPDNAGHLAGLPRTWHSTKDKAQFAFLDGHVEMIDVNDLQPNGQRFAEAWGPKPSPVPR